MNFRLNYCAMATCALTLFTASSAGAAVTVIGPGLSQNCYEAAEFSTDAAAGVDVCTRALNEDAMSSNDRAATYVNRGILRSRDGNTSGALSDYNKGLQISPDLAEGYVDRGTTLILMHRYEEAIVDINKGLALNAKQPHIAYYDRAMANEAMGNVKEAYYDYKQALELEPDFQLAESQLTRFKVVRKKP